MHRLRAIALCCALAMLAGVAHAQDRNDAERRLQGVRSELKQVAAERRTLEGERGDASRKLREADEQGPILLHVITQKGRFTRSMPPHQGVLITPQTASSASSPTTPASSSANAAK